MYDNILAVTNRRLCVRPLTEQLEIIAKAGVRRIILREKDLTEAEYESLAREAKAVCEKYGAELIPHTYINAAKNLGFNKIHLSMLLLRAYGACGFETVGASVHSVSEAIEAERLGASYITAGHVFATDCKKGVPPRGIEFLKEVCAAVSIPVYAIGGMKLANVSAAAEAGAYGAAIMSEMMTYGN